MWTNTQEVRFGLLSNITSLLYRAKEETVTGLPPVDQTFTDNLFMRSRRTVRDLKIRSTTTKVKQPRGNVDVGHRVNVA